MLPTPHTMYRFSQLRGGELRAEWHVRHLAESCPPRAWSLSQLAMHAGRRLARTWARLVDQRQTPPATSERDALRPGEI